MDIRFCERCHESIPDGDFEAGRAVSADGRTWHVACALSRALALTGRRAWLTFALAVYAAGAATFALVTALRPEERPDDVPPAVEARIQGAVANVEREAREVAALAAEAVREEAVSGVRALRADVEQLRRDISVLEGRILDTDRLATSRLAAVEERMASLEAEFRRLDGWIREVSERAVEPRESPTSPPVPVEGSTEGPPIPEEPEPPFGEPSTPERDAEVDRWIERLKDANEGIRFSATLELGRLKDPRSIDPLIAVMNEDRDFYVRLGAATALGDLRAVDAVPHLIERLDDSDGLVRTAANDALRVITKEQRATDGTDILFDADMSRTERRRVQRQWRDWWKTNEDPLRLLLGQPRR